MGNSAIKFIEIDEPQTAAEADHQRKSGRSKKVVGFNDVGTLGGLCRIRGYSQVHYEAAKRYLDLMQGETIGGGTVDFTREQVDKSTVAHDAGAAALMDRNRRGRAALDALDFWQQGLLRRVILLNQTLEDVLVAANGKKEVDAMPERTFVRSRTLMKQKLFEALELFAKGLGLA